MALGKEEKIVFRTCYRLYEYCVILIGLTNVLITLQAIVNKILYLFLDDFYIAYIDDVIIYLGEVKDYKGQVKQVLLALKENGIKVKLEKSEFRVTEV